MLRPATIDENGSINALQIATGGQDYTSPPLCKLHLVMELF